MRNMGVRLLVEMIRAREQSSSRINTTNRQALLYQSGNSVCNILQPSSTPSKTPATWLELSRLTYLRRTLRRFGIQLHRLLSINSITGPLRSVYAAVTVSSHSLAS